MPEIPPALPGKGFGALRGFQTSQKIPGMSPSLSQQQNSDKIHGKRENLELRVSKSVLSSAPPMWKGHLGVWGGMFPPLSDLDDVLLIGILIFQWKHWDRQCWQRGGEGFQQLQQSPGICTNLTQSPGDPLRRLRLPAMLPNIVQDGIFKEDKSFPSLLELPGGAGSRSCSQNL